MNILFAGSPSIAVPSLKAVSALEQEGKGIALAGILTNPDSPRGRQGRFLPTDVSAAALELDKARTEKGLKPIPQLKPEKLDARAREEAAALSPDLLVSFAYGRIFGPRFLSLFPLGGINIHPSLLPKYRGASPIPAVILAGEKETGICIQRLAAELDTGDILALERFPLSGRETAFSLSETVSHKAALLLQKLLRDYSSMAAQARPQEGEASYCCQIKKEDGLIDWNKSAEEIDARIRAYTPWPLCFTRRGNETLYILEAEPLPLSEAASPGKEAPGKESDTGKEAPAKERPGATYQPGTVLGTDSRGILIQSGRGVLAVSRLQWQAKKALDWKAFCNGARDFIGSRLG